MQRNIAICIDENFVMQACVFLESLKATNTEGKIDVYVVSEKISDKAKSELLGQVAEGNLTLNFCEIDMSKMPVLSVAGKEHLSLATYYRLLMPFVLPENVGNVLYLDCDMIVLDSLDELFETDISSVACAATIDMFNDDPKIPERLEYDCAAGYFNAGMIYINLKKWHEEKISERAIDFLRLKKEKCTAHDQDALNHAINGNYKNVSARYNMQLDFFCDFSNLIVDEKYFSDIKASRKNPCIIHFTGPTKPWLKNCVHPYAKVWDFFCEKTRWKNLKKKYEYKGFALLRYMVKKILVTMHLYKIKKPFLAECYDDANNIFDNLRKMN